jgi:hypothetical protein
MHRSGTSALAGTLGLLGCRLPGTLLPADDGNPRGYFESAPIMALHDAVMADVGLQWFDPDRIDPGYFSSAQGDRRAAELHAVLDAEFDQGMPALVKDPRLCQLLPLWWRVLGERGLSGRVVIPVRHPLEVAQSLHRRNGFSIDFCLSLWLHHMTNAIQDSAGQCRVVVHYHELISDWRAAVGRIEAGLGLGWPTPSTDAAETIDRFLSPALHRNRVEPGRAIDGALAGGLLAEAYSLLLEACSPGADAERALGRMNPVRDAITRAWSLLGGALADARAGRDHYRNALTASEALAATWREQADAARLEAETARAALERAHPEA